jgi:tRNA-splicing endonuclease subunit Sen34
MAGDSAIEPFPIFEVAGRYFLYDINVIAYVRENFRMCGVFIGMIPSAQQQNIFNGVPVELMTEEARLLASQGHAYVIDDSSAHLRGFLPANEDTKMVYKNLLEEKGLEGARNVQAGVNQRKAKWANSALEQRQKRKKSADQEDESSGIGLFEASEPENPESQSKADRKLLPLLSTPTISYPPLQLDVEQYPGLLPKATSSYPLYAHLHSKGYYLTPGLRFGCQYTAYPGDTLRYHSHFLVTGKTWDQPIDLADIVAGGRLGTGVKKGFLLGGEDSEKPKDQSSVRTFCFEWAAM